MKSVMISIKPKWCELIASGKKTIEVRKTRPKIDTPFKCYIYETKDKTETPMFIDEEGHEIYEGRGEVIGWFICDNIFPMWSGYAGNMGDDCLSFNEREFYLANKGGYGWHISDLVIYDKPKELSEFYKEDFDEALSNWKDLFSSGLPKPKREDYILKRPAQSWCYVEEILTEIQ